MSSTRMEKQHGKWEVDETSAPVARPRDRNSFFNNQINNAQSSHVPSFTTTTLFRHLSIPHRTAHFLPFTRLWNAY
jgi:hypothetical protein